MPFSRPRLSDLQSQIESDITSRIEGAVPALRRSVFGALSRALAAIAHGLHAFLQDRALQSVPYTATGFDLESWASLFSVLRSASALAAGPVAFSGTPGNVISAGSTLVSAAGAEYEVSSLVTIDGGGTGVGSVTALAPGAAGNLASSSVLSFISAPIGIDSTATVAPPGLQGGRDVGSDDDLRAALVARIQNPPHGGTAADYEFWALQVPAISRAWVFPLYSGAGTVRVFVANDAYVGATLADPADVTAAQVYIDAAKPVTVAVSDGMGGWVSGVTVIAPTRQPVPVSLSVTPDTPAVRAAIEANLALLFADEAAPEAGIPLNHIRVAIATAAGEFDHVLTLPASAPVAAANSILTLGTITWL